MVYYTVVLYLEKLLNMYIYGLCVLSAESRSCVGCEWLLGQRLTVE